VQHGSPPVVPVVKELFNDATIVALAVRVALKDRSETRLGIRMLAIIDTHAVQSCIKGPGLVPFCRAATRQRSPHCFRRHSHKYLGRTCPGKRTPPHGQASPILLLIHSSRSLLRRTVDRNAFRRTEWDYTCAAPHRVACDLSSPSTTDTTCHSWDRWDRQAKSSDPDHHPRFSCRRIQCI
jgi:hypothetical protein